jgi:tetratricopeptide (TPR) repeat protein
MNRQSAELLLLAVICVNAGPEVLHLSAGQSTTQSTSQKDMSEHDAFTRARSIPEPAARGVALEDFATQYPGSTLRMNALDLAMAAYQETGNQLKVEESAGRILELDPGNVRALAVITYLARFWATDGNITKLNEICTASAKGLAALPSWRSAESIPDREFVRLRQQMAIIFYGGAGFCALHDKNYEVARSYYAKALELDPDEAQDAFQLSIAALESSPLDPVGFWYCAKSISLASAQKNETIARNAGTYCIARYRKYHASDEGWDRLVASTAMQSAAPAGFAESIPIGPTEAQLVCQAMRQYDTAELSFSDWVTVLKLRAASPCNRKAADRVWSAIQLEQKHRHGRLEVPGKVISVSGNRIDMAISDDNQLANQTDLKVFLRKPITKPPARGSMISVTGEITRYKLNPFSIVMERAKKGIYKRYAPIS